MNQQTLVKQFLKSIGAAQAGSRTGWITARCPLAPWTHQNGIDKSPSFGIKTDATKAHCFSCHFSGDLWDLLFELQVRGVKGLGEARALLEQFDEQLPVIVSEEDLDKPVVDLVEFSEDWLASFPKAESFHAGRCYLRNRNVSEAVAEALDLRYDPINGNRVCFPVRDFDGTLRGLHGRTTVKDVEPRYMAYRWKEKYNPLVWLGEDHIDLNRPIVLVESVFDLAAVLPIYGNVMASLHSGLTTERVKRISGALEVVTFYDADKAGDHARKMIGRVLIDSVVWHAYPSEDENDPGAMSPERIAEVLGEYLPL